LTAGLLQRTLEMRISWRNWLIQVSDTKKYISSRSECANKEGWRDDLSAESKEETEEMLLMLLMLLIEDSEEMSEFLSLAPSLPTVISGSKVTSCRYLKRQAHLKD
jgi:hypothetical protein